MFRTVPLSIIRSSLTVHSAFHPGPARKLSTNLYDIYHCWVYSEWTPDDGQRHCPKHVDFHAKNKFAKLVHLVGLITKKLQIRFRKWGPCFDVWKIQFLWFDTSCWLFNMYRRRDGTNVLRPEVKAVREEFIHYSPPWRRSLFNHSPRRFFIILKGLDLSIL